jgi:hypothetical protein
MEMKVPMSLQRRVPFNSLSDQSWPWGSQSEDKEKDKVQAC